MNKVYLGYGYGDGYGYGVYIEQDDQVPGALTMTTENGIRVTNRIYLEPEVLAALDQYRKKYGR